ncbi:MAG: pH-response regulator protein palH/rim21 [Alectoria fallacina]|uniref:PH-response regulator protein palH/rim21 n=1 Tax=Alectoria fallacina TaxID=1903189 RepID=A0A8H3JA88_9LECA|nr:MAG: pH-response regulator protein palH/rim21 [Alectoria fallacina]
MDAIPRTISRRQIWADPTSTSSELPHTCQPYTLPSGGEINIGRGTIITLTQDAGFQPACSGSVVPAPIDPLQPGVDLSVLNRQDPFYSSTNPQIYAIAAATIVSYMLLIILFITPRTFFVGGAGGGGGFLGSRGMISGAYGSNSVIGIGSRPWLQKLAALTVAMSLTIVTAETFKFARQQYDAGYQDASELTVKVINGVEVRVARTILETCLWLAQAQTLIRLFPRHKEKLLIKWCAFALIIMELIFTILNQFVIDSTRDRSQSFTDAVPAMNYLFALALNLCYGTFVIYFALQKRRFAFFHPQMRNMPLVALLSLTAVLIPVVFFVLDLSKPNISGWGCYVRWVGAAAASVVVWEWVERIEALEREEKKDGILGREIFDGDEMLDATPSSESNWPSQIKRNTRRNNRSRGSSSSMSTGWHEMTAKARHMGRSRQRQNRDSRRNSSANNAKKRYHDVVAEEQCHPARPLPVASPVSRADTSSAGSTVYLVRYHPATDPTVPIQEDLEESSDDRDDQRQHFRQSIGFAKRDAEHVEVAPSRGILMNGLQWLPNSFRRQRTTPPPEVVRALAVQPLQPGPSLNYAHQNSLLERLHLKKSPKATEVQRPVIVVPAPAREPSSSDHELDSLNSGYESDGPTERSKSASTGTSTGRDADLPPDAVLNVINTPQQSNTVSPRSESRPPLFVEPGHWKTPHDRRTIDPNSIESFQKCDPSARNR